MRSRLLDFVSFQQFHHRLAEGKANIHIDFAMAIVVGVGGPALVHGMGIDSGGVVDESSITIRPGVPEGAPSRGGADLDLSCGLVEIHADSNLTSHP